MFLLFFACGSQEEADACAQADACFAIADAGDETAKLDNNDDLRFTLEHVHDGATYGLWFDFPQGFAGENTATLGEDEVYVELDGAFSYPTADLTLVFTMDFSQAFDQLILEASDWDFAGDAGTVHVSSIDATLEIRQSGDR